MIIQFYGNQFFRIQFGNLVVAYNPVSKSSKFKSSKFGADIGISSFNHPDLNGLEEVRYGDKEPFAISGPGEYEIQDVFIKGFQSKGLHDKVQGINTIYQITLENMNLLFLGALSESDLEAKTKENIEDVDILFVPVGGALAPSESYKLSVKLEPKIIIPMGYERVDDKNLQTFLKEGSADSTRPEDKLTIKKKDIVDSEGEIRFLNLTA